MYALAALYERHEGRRLDGLLQVGDIGAFPDTARLDSATRKHAAHDPDELGFQDYIRRTPESERVLGAANAPRAFLVRGNHEDFQYLQGFKTPTAMDPWGALTYLPDGSVLDIGDVDCPVRLGAFGGIHPPVEQRGRGKAARQAHRRAQSKADHDPRYFSEREIDRAFPNTDVDVLLTHAGPACEALSQGSAYLESLGHRLSPRVHLFGHHHEVVEPCTGPGDSLLVGLEHLAFEPSGRLKYGGWGILTYSQDGHEFTFCSASQMPWLASLTRETYRELAFDL